MYINLLHFQNVVNMNIIIDSILGGSRTRKQIIGFLTFFRKNPYYLYDEMSF